MLADLTESRGAAAAYAALIEFERLAALLPLAPRLTDRIDLARMIAQRHEQCGELLERLRDAAPSQAVMTALTALIDDARRRVESSDWWEALATAALSAPLTDELFAAFSAKGPADLQSEASVAVEPSNERADEGDEATGPDTQTPQQWAMQRLRTALGEDPVLAARIAMWGRRLVGEVIVLAREFGGDEYPDLANRLATSHARRLADLGLAG